jgi:hypothetical protein
MYFKNIAMWIQKYIEASVSDMPRHLEIRIKKERLMKKDNQLEPFQDLEGSHHKTNV